MSGMVRPIVASSEPRQMLMDRCKWFASAERTAPIIDGAAELLRQIHQGHHVGYEQNCVHPPGYVGTRGAVMRLVLVHAQHEIAAMPAGLHTEEGRIQADAHQPEKGLLRR